MSDDSVNESIRLFERYRADESLAAEELFQRYVARLTALVRTRMSPRLARRLDAEDVVQSAYRTFFTRAKEGDFELGNQKGQYVLEANTVRLKTNISEISYQFELTASELTLSGGDLTQSLKFTRVRSISDYEDWLSYLSPQSLISKLKRIAVIFVIVVSCRILLLVFQLIIHCM